KPGTSEGIYMIVGTVLAEANGTPIFADKVLTKIDAELTAKAKQSADFATAAELAIRKQLESDIRDELEFAAASRNSTDEEQQRAAGYTTHWRQNEIIKAGGSLAVTR